MTAPFCVAMLIPAFGAAVIYDSAWPVIAWLAVLVVYGLLARRK